jgi:hypothetical protein
MIIIACILNCGEEYPMPYELNYEEAGFIRLFYEGDANLKDMKKVIARGVSLATEKNCFGC